MQHDASRDCSADLPELDSCNDIVTTYLACGDIDVPDEKECVASSHCGSYDPGAHTVTWQIGEVAYHGSGSVEPWTKLICDSLSVKEILNTCAIGAHYHEWFATWDSCLVSCVSVQRTTWGKVKSLFQ
jgi:hypothetical protein